MNQTTQHQPEITPAQQPQANTPRKTWTPPTVKATGELKALVQLQGGSIV